MNRGLRAIKTQTGSRCRLHAAAQAGRNLGAFGAYYRVEPFRGPVLHERTRRMIHERTSAMTTVANYAVLTRNPFGFATNLDAGTSTPPRVFTLSGLPAGARFDRDAILTFRITNIGGTSGLAITAEESPGVNRVVMTATVTGEPRAFQYVIPAINFGRTGSISVDGTFITIDDVVLWFQQDV